MFRYLTSRTRNMTHRSDVARRQGRTIGSRRLCLEPLEARLALSTSYIATDLVSDEPGVAPIVDPHLHNAWGVAVGPTGGNFWVSSEGDGLSDVYGGDVNGAPLNKNSLEVAIPGGEPTGQVFNTTADFVVHSGAASGPSVFIFASASGSVSGWNPTVPPPPPATNAQLGFQATDGAIYRGITLSSSGGQNYLYVADFANGKIDVLDKNFQLVHLAGSFTAPNTPDEYAPFNVAAIGGKIYVAYAQQEEGGEEEAHGQGKGFVDVFTTDGQFIKRLISQGDHKSPGKLNAPWGMVVAPSGFGEFSNTLLVGNVGSGRILAFDPNTGAFKGTLKSAPNKPIQIEELWGLTFGNGVTAGDAKTLYYAAGPDDEAHGLFGKITANPEGTVATKAALAGDVLQITGGRTGDNVLVSRGDRNQIVVRAEGKKIGTFNIGSVATIQFQGFAGDDFINISSDLKIKTILDGGADDDTISGGGGANILLGGPGNDWLWGGTNRDILIGGEGKDHVFAGFGDDIVIGGTTAHDGNSAALLQILAEWTSADSFDVRKQKIQNGTGGLPKLDDNTVFDDGARDILFGGPGRDWIFKNANDFSLDV